MHQKQLLRGGCNISDLSEQEVFERVFEGLLKSASCARQMAKEFVDGTSRHKKAHDDFINLAEQFEKMISIAKSKRAARSVTKAMNELLIDRKLDKMKVANGESPTKH